MEPDNQQYKRSDNVTALAVSDTANLSPQQPENRHMIESLRKLQRADAFFHKLTAEQQDTLLKWLHEIEDLGTVLSRVTAPAPQGFGVQVSLVTLRRFRSRWRALGSIMETEEMLDQITDMELAADLTQTPRIQKAINHMLHEKAFDLARTHPGSDTLKTVLTSIEKLSALDYKKQKLLLEREKLQHAKESLPVRLAHHRVDLNILPSNQTQSVRSIPDPEVKRIADNSSPPLENETVSAPPNKTTCA